MFNVVHTMETSTCNVVYTNTNEAGCDQNKSRMHLVLVLSIRASPTLYAEKSANIHREALEVFRVAVSSELGMDAGGAGAAPLCTVCNHKHDQVRLCLCLRRRGRDSRPGGLQIVRPS